MPFYEPGPRRCGAACMSDISDRMQRHRLVDSIPPISPLLYFSRELERVYRQDHDARHLGRTRLILVCGCVIFLIGGLQDLLFLDSMLATPAFAVQALFICPWLLACLAYTYAKDGHLHMDQLSLVAAAGAAAGMLAVLFYANARGVEYYYEGLLVLLIVIYFLLTLNVWQALTVGLGLSCIYVAVSTITPYDSAELGARALYMLSANLVGFIGAYSAEKAERRNFLVSRRLQDLADRDGLTQLRNRRFLTYRLPMLRAQADRDQSVIAIALFDVDYFKAYNDIYGHVAGDECLKRLAEVFEGYARRPLDIAVRYGGEELLMVWYDVRSHGHARQMADSLRSDIEALKMPHVGSDAGDYVTVSAGVAAAIPSTPHMEQHILEAADAALYQAKLGGRNRTALGHVPKAGG